MIRVIVDGSCRQGVSKIARAQGEMNHGAWAAVIDAGPGSPQRTVTGYSADTTNTEMELIAAIEGLAAIDPAAPVVLFTDFQETANLHMRWREWSAQQLTDVRRARPLWADLLDQFDRVPVRVVLVGRGSSEHDRALVKLAHVACRARLRGDVPVGDHRLLPAFRGHARVSLSVRRPG